MGTWGSGPFANDHAGDFVSDLLQQLFRPIDVFLASPEIDETFDAAFAALAVLNEVIERTGVRPWKREADPIVTALIQCFDEQIDGLGPSESFKAEHRAALVSECERFQALLAR